MSLRSALVIVLVASAAACGGSSEPTSKDPGAAVPVALVSARRIVVAELRDLLVVAVGAVAVLAVVLRVGVVVPGAAAAGVVAVALRVATHHREAAAFVPEDGAVEADALRVLAPDAERAAEHHPGLRQRLRQLLVERAIEL